MPPPKTQLAALLREYRKRGVLTRIEVGAILQMRRGQIAGICHRNGIKPWPKVSAETKRKRYCCFPLGHPGEDDLHLCGRPRITGHPFLCEMHEEERWQPAQSTPVPRIKA